MGAADAPEPSPPLPSALRSGAPKLVRSRAQAWARCFASHGTTTLEARSGFGLELQSEISALRAVRFLDGQPLEVTAGFVARGMARGKATFTAAEAEQVTDVLLPIIRRRRLASVCDVPCGPAEFDVDRARLILERARELGFGIRVHGDRYADSGAARLAVEVGAWSLEGLERISDAEIDLLGGSSTLATLLPGVGYAEGGDRYEPARRLVDRGAAVALATGFGPQSPTLSMPMVLSLACRKLKLSCEEAITAATIQGAAALGRAERLGSLEPGKQADLVMLDVRDYREIPYYFGFNLCVLTMKKGRVVYQAPGREVSKT